jgi:RimJ/RimL family protein N-acetyltransferase
VIVAREPRSTKNKNQRCDVEPSFHGNRFALSYQTTVMPNAFAYRAIEQLRDGSKVVIRALKPEDRTKFRAAADRTGAESLRRRFFGAKRHFSEQEAAFFLNIDFVNHVALVAVAQEQGRDVIVGGARYVIGQPGTAELAVTVIDQYQGRGIGAVLTRHLIALARDAGVKELIAIVLPENAPMLKVLQQSGRNCKTRRQDGVVEVTLAVGDDGGNGGGGEEATPADAKVVGDPANRPSR